MTRTFPGWALGVYKVEGGEANRAIHRFYGAFPTLWRRLGD